MERRSVGRTISKNTENAYRADLAVWEELLTAQVGHSPTLEDLEPTAIKACLAEMNSQNKASASRRRALATLSGLCKYLVLEGRMTSDPTTGIQPPKADARLPIAFTDRQVDDLITTAGTPDEAARPATPELDLALLLILAAGGLRASEAADLSLRDYTSGDEPALRVRGKGGKLRVVPLDPPVAEVIDVYLAWRATRTDSQELTAPLLVRANGRKFTRDTVDYRVDRLYRRAGVPKPDGEVAHALRHTYAISMVNSGVAISEVSSLLGHESIATTGIYLRASGAHLRTAAAAPSAARALRRR